MAGENRRQARALELLAALEREPHRFDLFQALRRLECAFPERRRLGQARRPADEPVRLGQEPSLAFAERAIAGFTPSPSGPPRLSVFGFGVFGPNGPLPLHVTEYAHDRLHNAGDATMARFLDVFHHRLLSLFYRAYADAEPAIARDRPASDRFAWYVGALIGMGVPSTRDRDLLPDATRLHYAGLLAPQPRNADGLSALVRDLFRVGTHVEQFVGEWVDIPPRHRSSLGLANCLLGRDALLGSRTWIHGGKFRLVLGPLLRAQFDGFLPGGPRLRQLEATVRAYAGDELAWDLELVLATSEERMTVLGRSRLGWDSALGVTARPPGGRGLVFPPERRRRGSEPPGVPGVGARPRDPPRGVAHA